MDQHKIIRSVCLFTDNPSLKAIARLGELTSGLSGRGFTIQTQRLCSPESDGIFQLDKEGDGSVRLSIGRLNFERATGILDPFCNAKNNVDFNVDLTHELITVRHISLLTNIIHRNAGKTFSFAYTFNNSLSSPFFPSASYEKNGFAIGLQPTNLSEGCKTIEEWLERTKEVWSEIDSIFAMEEDYLGIDTSVAPLFAGYSSFINFLTRIGLNFNNVVTTDVFIRISSFIRKEGPKKVGLCGLMFACLEDFELAEVYEEGNFSIERNAFLSLHSGLGIDAYPIGVDENPERVTQILKLMQGLSNKYSKPLSIRLVSDGIAKIGQKTNFGNPYLKDVIIRPL